jgi:hypothetical protein
MNLTCNPVEQTTATTSALLASLAFAIVFYLYHIQRRTDRLKNSFWLAGLFLLGLTGLVESVTHGFKLSGATVFKLLDLGPILAAGMFLCGVAHDLHGPAIARQALPLVVAVGLVFYLAVVQLPVPSVLIAVYKTVALLPAFIFYSWLASRFGFEGAWWMSCGAVLFIFAAWLQATRSLELDLIFSFDSYAVSNVICTFSVLSLALGIRNSLAPYRKIHQNRVKDFAGHSGNRLDRR